MTDDDRPQLDYVQIAASPEFRALRRAHRRFVLPVLAFSLAWYLAYVLCATYADELMARSVAGEFNVGLLFGLSQFAVAFGVTGWYAWYANRELDPKADALRADLGRREAGR